jgi:ADP-heptose:LPS heptosyltransferase/lauroyl/myristoyl acyltransferase
MCYFLLCALGRLLCITPTWFLSAACRVFGAVFYVILFSRRCVILNNLRRVYPELPPRQIRRMALLTSARLIELALLPLAMAFFSKRRIAKNFSIEGNWWKIAERSRPQLILIAHQTLSEALTLVPAAKNGSPIEAGVLYRPFKNRAIDRFVERSRKRFGIKPLARDNAIVTLCNLLRNGNGCAAVLFDQYAGPAGVQTLLCNRVAIATPLPEILAAHSDAEISMCSVRRSGFWRGTLVLEPLHTEGKSLTLDADLWLENKLLNDKNFRDNWLWAHRRWKRPNGALLNLQWKKDKLNEACALRKLKSLPRKTEICLRMANWLGDNVMALPIIRSIRLGRPDAKITLLCRPAYAEWLRSLAIADEILPLPHVDATYFIHLLKDRYPSPDQYITFTNSMRGAFEAFILGAPTRIRFGGKRFCHSWPFTNQFAAPEPNVHRTMYWHKSLEEIGLPPALSDEPFVTRTRRCGEPSQIAIFFGANNNRRTKCWPAEKWNVLAAELMAQFPEASLLLLGSERDRSIAKRIASGLPTERVRNLSGLTTVPQVVNLLRGCDLAVAVDSGGMHLANCCAVPTVAMFGPTNPLETGPFYGAPKIVVQPPNCSPSGGLPIDCLSPSAVVDGALELASRACNYQ